MSSELYGILNSGPHKKIPAVEGIIQDWVNL